MFKVEFIVQRAIGLGVYALAIIALSSITLWAAGNLSQSVLGMLDELIIDGSGQLPADHDSTTNMASAIAASRTIRTSASEITKSSQSLDPRDSLAIVTAASARPVIPPQEVTQSDPAYDYYNGENGTYRTYCVRLCDGYFFPISFSTTSDHFEEDAARCERSCGSPSKLFVHQIPGGSTATMTTVDGLPYRALKTAFLFRTRFDAQCKCHANPWEQQALTRHKLFAAQKDAKDGKTGAASVVASLSAELATTARQDAAKRAALAEEADRELAALARKVGTKPVEFVDRKTKPARVAEVKPPKSGSLADGGSLMRLGGVENQASSKGWRPASGADRHWSNTVFEGN
ncbi:MAG: DUF2865 domain-containing protein [Hyphomicrobiaceae bacterium]